MYERDFGILPRRLDFSRGCAVQVPVAPAVGAMLAYLCLVPWWHRVRSDACMVSWLDACAAAGPGCYVLGLVQRCWPALVGWRFLCVCAFGGFLL